MKSAHACLLLAGLLLPCVSGCANHNVVRGQNADMTETAAGVIPSNYDYTGQPSSVVYGDGAYDANGYPCDASGAPLRVHHDCYKYTYRQPAGLVYPPANQPPAVIQWPYYTVRGPTDFFYTGE